MEESVGLLFSNEIGNNILLGNYFNDNHIADAAMLLITRSWVKRQ